MIEGIARGGEYRIAEEGIDLFDLYLHCAEGGFACPPIRHAVGKVLEGGIMHAVVEREVRAAMAP